MHMRVRNGRLSAGILPTDPEKEMFRFLTLMATIFAVLAYRGSRRAKRVVRSKRRLANRHDRPGLCRELRARQNHCDRAVTQPVVISAAHD